MRIFLFIIAALSICTANAFAQGQGCITTECHPKILDKKFVHGPVAVQDCEYCHTKVGDHKFKLAATGQELCAICHEFKSKDKNVKCLSCHDQHGSSKEFMIKDNAPAGRCAISN